MSSQKLSRQFLHVVTGESRGRMYSLSRMNVSTLFYPSTFEAQIKASASEGSSNVLGANTIAQMRRPSLQLGVHYPLGDNDGFRDVFARLGGGKLLCADGSGHAAVYDFDAHSFVGMPTMNSHKDSYIAVPVRCAAKGGVFGDDKRGESVYLLDYRPDTKSCCFEALENDSGAGARWRWRALPPPPFFADAGYNSFHTSRGHAVVGDNGAKICVSSAAATYAFDTAALEWSKVGDWVLPFHGKAEHVPELGLWFATSARRPDSLCAVDLSSFGRGASGCPPPPAHHVGLDLVEASEDWWLSNQTVVNLGMGKFCVARMFFIEKHEHLYDHPVVVFTGVEVLRCPAYEDGYQEGEPQFQVIKHKTEYFAEEFIRHMF